MSADLVLCNATTRVLIAQRAAGADWPLFPLYAIHCALTRRAWAWDAPERRLNPDDCLAAYPKGRGLCRFLRRSG